MSMQRSWSIWPLSIAVIIWLAVVGAGFAVLESYASRPARALDVPATWPHDAALPPSSATPTVLVFLHPRCGCSTATMRELERLVAEITAPFELHLLYFCPSSEPETWAQRSTWEIGGRIPGAVRTIDRDGALAAHFGAHTSGTVLCYDRAATLRFAGGLTIRRAHEGRSPGRQMLARVLRGEVVPDATAPVFGCTLLSCPAESSP